MKVYLVFHCEGELEGIYSTKEKAQAVISHCGADAKHFFIAEEEVIE